MLVVIWRVFNLGRIDIKIEIKNEIDIFKNFEKFELKNKIVKQPIKVERNQDTEKKAKKMEIIKNTREKKEIIVDWENTTIFCQDK